MATILYTSCFVPGEWIGAHGFSPQRVIPELAADVATGVCPYAAGFMHAAGRREAAGIVVAGDCDQMRRACERYLSSHAVPVFLMHVPATWQTTGSHRLYRQELLRLGRFLESLGGTAPDEPRLIAVMKEHERKRAELAVRVPSLSARAYVQARIAFHENGALPDPMARDVTPVGDVPLALVGGPLLRQHLALFALIEAAGGALALDATDHGERGFPARWNGRALRDDPLACLVDAYFGAIPDAFRRPNTELYRWLQRRLPESGARGVIFVHYVWCDTWHAEAERLRQ